MNISLFCTSDRRDKIYKNVSPVDTSVEVKLKNNTDIMAPVFMLQTSNLDLLTSANYLYCEGFKRWYFINNWTSVTSNIFEIHCNVDVLYTYKDEIGSCAGILDRSQADGQPYLDDRLLLEKASKNIRTMAFKNGDTGCTTGLSLILVTANTN